MIEAAFSWLVGRLLDLLLLGFSKIMGTRAFGELLKRFRIRLDVDELFRRDLADASPEDTQSGMNVVAWSDVEIATAILEKELNLLRLRLDKLGCDRLEAAQKAWKQFAEKEVASRSNWCEGGTMSPTIRAGEMRRLLLDRTATIREQIKELDQY